MQMVKMLLKKTDESRNDQYVVMLKYCAMILSDSVGCDPSLQL